MYELFFCCSRGEIKIKSWLEQYSISLEKYLQIVPFLLWKLLLQNIRGDLFSLTEEQWILLSAFINLSRLSEVNLVNLWMKWWSLIPWLSEFSKYIHLLDHSVLHRHHWLMWWLFTFCVQDLISILYCNTKVNTTVLSIHVRSVNWGPACWVKVWEVR